LAQFINRENLLQFFRRLLQKFKGSGNLYLIGETTQLIEGWRSWIDKIEFTSDISPEDKSDFVISLERVSLELSLKIVDESPADVMPLPEGYQERMLPIENFGGLDFGSGTVRLKISHYDPYSVAFKSIARGDEEDYQLVINYLKNGWLTVEKMDSLLSDLLPRFSFKTIQQDPAEFRRKYKGLLQIWEDAKKESVL